MSQDERTATLIHLVFYNLGKNNGLTRSGGKYQKSLPVPLVPLGQDRIFCLGLIRSKLHHQKPLCSQV